MNEDVAQLDQTDRLERELARIDAELAKLAARRADGEAAVVRLTAERDAAKAALDANKTEERAAQRRVDELQNNRKSAIRILESGAGSADAAQRQVERCDALIDEGETAVLGLLEAQDTLTSALASANRLLASATTTAALNASEIPPKIVQLEGDREVTRHQRDQSLAQLPSDLRTRYEAFRGRGRYAVARIVGGSCDACSMAVQPQMMADLWKGKIVACHGCHRWLIPPEEAVSR